MSEVIHDIDRPDVNGVPPKMAAICEQFQTELAGLAPVLSIKTNDNLLSHISIRGSCQHKEDWPWNIFENSRYFHFEVNSRGKRYYTDGDQLTVQLTVKHHELAKFRKYHGTPAQVIAKVKQWLIAAVLQSK